MKDLIIRLRESGTGCFLFGEYAGCAFYADDIILLSASLKQLHMMLIIVHLMQMIMIYCLII